MKKIALSIILILTFFAVPVHGQITQLLYIPQFGDSVRVDTTGIDSVVFTSPVRTLDVFTETADVYVWLITPYVDTYTATKPILIPQGGNRYWEAINVRKLYLKKRSGSGNTLVWVTTSK